MQILRTVKERVRQLLEGPQGEALLSDLEREAAEKVRAVDARRALVAEIAALERRRETEVPPLRAEANRLRDEFHAARARVRPARLASTTAASRASALADHLDSEVRRLRDELARGCDPAIKELFRVAEQALEATTPRGGLFVRETREVLVEAHRSDPNYKFMRVAGTKYRRHAIGTNAKALEEVHSRVVAALRELRELALEPAPPDLDTRLQRLREAFAVPTSPPEPIVWSEPQAPRYDAEGNRLGADGEPVYAAAREALRQRRAAEVES